MEDLVTWYRAQLDAREQELAEDERLARASDPGPWEVGQTFGARDTRVYVQEAGELGIDTIGTCVIAGQVANKTRFRENAQHIARWDPHRVLRKVATERADIAAKRRILDLRDAALADADDPGINRENGITAADQLEALDAVVALLALPMAGREGYQESWRP